MCIQGGGVGGKRAKEGTSLLGLKNKQTNVLNSFRNICFWIGEQKGASNYKLGENMIGL